MRTAAHSGALRFATALLLAIALGSLFPASASAVEARQRRPNLVGLELAGRGLLVTANYERSLTNRFGVGVGLTALPIAVLYASYMPSDANSLYLSAGGLVVAGAGTGSFFWPEKTTVILQGTVGYQFRFSNGFVARPLLTYNQSTVADLDFLFWPGVTIGRSF